MPKNSELESNKKLWVQRGRESVEVKTGGLQVMKFTSFTTCAREDLGACGERATARSAHNGRVTDAGAGFSR